MVTGRLQPHCGLGLLQHGFGVGLQHGFWQPQPQHGFGLGGVGGIGGCGGHGGIGGVGGCGGRGGCGRCLTIGGLTSVTVTLSPPFPGLMTPTFL